MYETFFPVPNADSVALHKFVERIFKTPGEIRERDYVWGHDAAKSCVHVRAPQATPSMTWQEIAEPSIGEEIEFSIRVSSRRKTPSGGRAPRPASKMPQWFSNVMLQNGTILTDLRHATERVALPVEPKAINLQVSRFSGTAIIMDPKRFIAALLSGIGDKKAYGFGYLQYQSI